MVGDRAHWLGLANNAWRYFQPGVGVDSKTGLHSSAWGWPYFTDWDLGVYIQAVVDANRLGIFGNDGTWGANARFDKILTFLETRELTSIVNRTNYAPVEQEVDALKNSKNLYDYYVASGFAAFWPSRFSSLASPILNNILTACKVVFAN